jgi:hypothetical protein
MCVITALDSEVCQAKMYNSMILQFEREERKNCGGGKDGEPGFDPRIP